MVKQSLQVGAHVLRGFIQTLSVDLYQHRDTDVFTIYQQLDDAISQTDATSLMHEDLASLGAQHATVITTKTWRYFPHVATEGHLRRLLRCDECAARPIRHLLRRQRYEHGDL
jgi:hypothetical protein